MLKHVSTMSDVTYVMSRRAQQGAVYTLNVISVKPLVLGACI